MTGPFKGTESCTVDTDELTISKAVVLEMLSPMLIVSVEPR